jgi:serine/threonine-protein kinase
MYVIQYVICNTHKKGYDRGSQDASILDEPVIKLEKLVGEVVAGKYRLTSLLGSGGSGFIYAAEQVGLGRSVAVKILRPELVATRRDWFRMEALAASRINHPHAIAIYDSGITGDGTPYMVMEHLRGRTLSAMIEKSPFDPMRAAGIAAQCLSALDEAHACGVVHCDLTADNVIVDRPDDNEDFAKVIDFGLAQLLEVPGKSSTLVGTAEYVAPEQIRGEAVSPKTDIYALGILLYEMIVGRTPYAGASYPVILEGHLKATPDSPHDLIPTCPPELGTLIIEALSKLPEDRPASAAAMRERLLAIFPSTDSPTTKSEATEARASSSSEAAEAEAEWGAPNYNTRLTFALGSQDSALVGRTEEIETIVSFCGGAHDANTMVICGPHGIGKAHLTHVAAKRSGTNTEVFAGAADPSNLKLSWYPILGVLEQVLGLRGTPDLETLAKAAASCGLPQRDVPGLAEAFGLEGPANQLELNVRRREARAATVRAMHSLGRRHINVVIVFADADRYDYPSLSIIGELQRSLPDNVRLIITTEGQDALSKEFDCDAVEVLTLEGLPPEHARELTERLAGSSHAIPDANAIYAITGGSPAAVEQLAGWIRLGHGVSSIPSLLVDLVSIRVNRLPVEARRVLQAVAIHGTLAPRAMVESTLEPAERAALLDSSWTGLLNVGLETLTIPTDLVAQVILACTPGDVRRNLHHRTLMAYGQHGRSGIRGHHAEQAGSLEAAYDLYIEAGNNAVRRFDDPGAAVWHGRAVACARALHAVGTEGARARLAGASVLLAEVLRQSGELSLAAGVCEEAKLFSPNDLQRAMIHRTLGVIAHSADDYERSVECIQLAIGDSLRAGDREFLCQCYLDLTASLEKKGRRAEAIKELEEGINVITLGEGLRVTNGPDRLWRLGLKLAEQQLLQGDADAALVTAKSSLALTMRSQSKHAQGRLSAMLARICEEAGERGAALRHRSNAIDALRSVGDRRSTAELLIETAKSSLAALKSSVLESDSKSTMRLARKLALEVGWNEGVTLSKA